MASETSQQPYETPLEAAARNEANPTAARTTFEEREADVLVADIDEYVSETDPQNLAEAERELNAWEIPQNSLDKGAAEPLETTLVSVFSAMTETEANIVKGVLESAGIPATLQNIGGAALGGIFTPGEQAWADVLVPESYTQAAAAAIKEASETTSG